MEAEREPKLKFKIDFKDLKEILSIPAMRGTLKKGDMVEIIDEKTGINRRCRVERITNMDNNPYYWKVHFLPSPFEIIEISTSEIKMK